MRRSLLVFAFAVAACATETVSEDKILEEDFYEDEDLGVQVDDFAWDELEGDYEGSHLKREQTGKITVAGQGTHDVRVTELDYYVDVEDPKAGYQVLEVEDLTSGNFRALTFAPQLGAILLESDDVIIEIVRNPDGSYTVDDKPAKNGRAAVDLVKDHPVFAGASAHGMLMAYSIAQKPSKWTSLMRAGANVEGPGRPPAPPGSKAEAGAVCERFQDFCDCAACAKLGQVDSCKKCPP